MSSFIEHINEFRRLNWVGPVRWWNSVDNWHCELHASYMMRCGIQHSPECFLNGKAEAIAACNFIQTWEDTIGHVIFEILGKCDQHREVMLRENVAYGLKGYRDTLYCVVRGW